jgi:hypothetical protein
MSITLYADDTSVLVTHYDRDEYKKAMNKIFSDINEWLNSTLLHLNYEKTSTLEFRPRIYTMISTNVSYNNNFISNNNRVKFLGLTLDTTLSWEGHINYVISKLNSLCFILRSLKPFVSAETMRAIYFAYAHSIMTYGIIFWGYSRYSVKVFMMQKRMFRIMTNLTPRDLRRVMFKELKILPFFSRYIYSGLIYLASNIQLYTMNREVHNYNTRNSSNFHMPNANLTKYQKGVYYMGFKLYNQLPIDIKNSVNNQKLSGSALKSFLHSNSFYTLEEF